MVCVVCLLYTKKFEFSNHFRNEEGHFLSPESARRWEKSAMTAENTSNYFHLNAHPAFKSGSVAFSYYLEVSMQHLVYDMYVYKQIFPTEKSEIQQKTD
jgi:hypothetical protein